MFGRSKFAMIVAEFLGVASMITVILSISKSGVGFSLFIASGVGFAVFLMSLALAGASNSHYNPAVTLGMWTTRKISTLDAVLYIAAQFLGALAAWQLYVYLVGQKLTNIAGNTFSWKVFVAEVVGAFVLTLGFAAAAYSGYRGLKYSATLGGAVFLGALIASVASNGLANPALALGVQSWSRAYVLGPLLGGVVGVNLYAYLFAPASERPTYAVATASRKTTTAKPVAKKKAAAKKKPAKKTTTKKK